MAQRGQGGRVRKQGRGTFTTPDMLTPQMQAPPVPMGDSTHSAETDVKSEKYIQGVDKATKSIAKLQKGAMALGVAFGLAVTAAVAFSKMRAFAEQQVLINRERARLSPTLAAAFAQRDYQQLQLDVRMARRTGGTGGFATRSSTALQRELQPWREMSEDVKNLGSGVISQLQVGALHLVELLGVTKGLQAIGELIKDKLGIKDEDPGQFPFFQAMGDLLNEAEGKRPSYIEDSPKDLTDLWGSSGGFR
jgi:hypothetical protein